MRNKKIIKKNKTIFSVLYISAGVMTAIVIVLLAVSHNVVYQVQDYSVSLLDEVQPASMSDADCLLVYEEDDDSGFSGMELMNEVLSQMKVGFDTVNTNEFDAEELENYQYLVFSVTHYQYIGEKITDVEDWVQAGGNLMILYPPEYNGSFGAMSSMLGIKDCGGTLKVVEGIKTAEGFMIGGDDRTFEITDPYDSSIGYSLASDCQVYVESTDQYPTPLIWKKNYGEGEAVVCNLGFLEKAFRGFYCAAFSLLGDSFIYPVINSSTFYIDDFPSPVPGGDSTYITRDYQMSIKDFYTNVWWPDVYNLAKKYHFYYTGMVIEEYSDQVSGTFTKNKETERYLYFGNMLLQAGGEIGFHGYNHMPLVLENFDYQDLYPSYIQWSSRQDMKNALEELNSFCRDLFPAEKFQVYVPPSNILSEEGRELLSEEFPQIRAIASVYIPGELAFSQEFDVSDDGMVNTPRIISGYIFDEYVDLLAFSELNFHFVNTHFQHPDDVLDEDRGASLGWEQMFSNLETYCDWLYTSAPSIRSLTGSELAGAVQRYDTLEVEREETKEGLTLKLGHFYDEAYFILRLNAGQTISDISGGSYEKLDGNLYLICAENDTVNIVY